MTRLDFRAFGWKKLTSLLRGFLDLSAGSQVCEGANHACGFTGRKHVVPKGLSSDGRFMTHIAQPHPQKLAQLLATLFAQQGEEVALSDLEM